MDAHQKTIITGARVLGCFVLWCVVLGASTAWAQTTPPKRIISLVPAVTEMLYAIGAGSQVVGVSSFDHFPAQVESLPRVGGLLDPDFERIVRLAPDLVIVYGTQTDLTAKLDRARIPMFSYVHSGLADVTSTIRQLGDRVGHASGAKAEATRIEQGLDAIRKSVAGQPRYRTLLIFGREAGSLRSVYASAGVGFLHDLLDVAGGEDIFGDVKRQSIQISAEQILARAPDAVVELHQDLRAEQLAAERQVWNRLPSVPAVKANRIYLLTSELLTIPGPRVVEAARMIADALHPRARK